MLCAEISVPAPWGHIAVKTWGDERNESILLSHGLLDNAGTYDRLIALLPTKFYYICIDFPGHGFSSAFPTGTPIITIDYIPVYKIVADFFKQKSYVIIGHSLGGQTAVTFAQLHPGYVKKLILLDAISYRRNFSTEFFQNIENAIEISLHPKKKRSIFTKAQALKILMKNRILGSLTEEAAECLMVRMFEKIGDDAFVSIADPRLKAILHPTYDDDLYFLNAHLKFPLKCEVLVILLDRGKFDAMFPNIFEYFKQRKFEIHLLKGHHHYHNTNPDLIAPIVSEFLTRKNKL